MLLISGLQGIEGAILCFVASTAKFSRHGHQLSKLGFLTVIDEESLEEGRSETGTGNSSNGVKAKVTLGTSALISELAHSVKEGVDDLMAGGVISSGEVDGFIK